MRPQIQQCGFILGNQRLSFKGGQAGGHHRHCVPRPILLHILEHEGVFRVLLHPVVSLFQRVRDFRGKAFQTDLQIFILQIILLGFGALLLHVVPDAFVVELLHRFSADHDIGDANQVNREGD